MKKQCHASYDNESDFYDGITSESKKGDIAKTAKDMIDLNADDHGYWDDRLNDIIAEIAAKGAEYADNEIESILNSYNITDPELREDVLETFKQIREADKQADKNIDPINLDTIDAMADAQAMANADNTPVTVTEEDKDSDGDTDKMTIEQQGNEDDNNNDPLQDIMSITEPESEETEDNSSEETDKPHDEENSTNQIAKHLASHRF